MSAPRHGPSTGVSFTGCLSRCGDFHAPSTTNDHRHLSRLTPRYRASLWPSRAGRRTWTTRLLARPGQVVDANERTFATVTTTHDPKVQDGERKCTYGHGSSESTGRTYSIRYTRQVSNHGEAHSSQICSPEQRSVHNVEVDVSDRRSESAVPRWVAALGCSYLS